MKSTQPQRVVRIVPTSVKLRKIREHQHELEKGRLQERAAAHERKRVARKAGVKREVQRGRVKARVCTAADAQEIQLESGSDVNSGEEDMLEEMRSAETMPAAQVPAARIVVAKTDGRVISGASANYEIISTLEKLRGSDLSTTFLAQATGIDLTAPENSAYREALRHNARVHFNADETLHLKASLGVEDVHGLRELFKTRLACGSVGAASEDMDALCVHEKELAGTYSTVARDVDELVATGDVVQMQDGGREQFRVYAPALPGLSVSERTRELWRSLELPHATEIRATLIDRGVRTQEQYDQRDAVKKMARQSAIALAKRPRARDVRFGVAEGKPDGDVSALLDE